MPKIIRPARSVFIMHMVRYGNHAATIRKGVLKHGIVSHVMERHGGKMLELTRTDEPYGYRVAFTSNRFPHDPAIIQRMYERMVEDMNKHLIDLGEFKSDYFVLAPFRHLPEWVQVRAIQ